MAINQTNVALDIASKAVAQAGKMLDALAVLEELLEHGLRADLNMTDYNAQFAESSELQHVDGATLNALLAIVTPGIRAALEGGMAGANTWEAVLYKARR